MRQAWAEVHLEAIRKNIRFLMSKIDKSTQFMGVVKADGYGHGAVPVARILEEEGAAQFAVAIPQEGIELRQAGFTQPILVLGAPFAEDIPLFLDYDLMPSVFTVEQAEQFSETAKRKGMTARIHIKVDTGMGRLGFLSEAPDTAFHIKSITEMENIQVEGIFSHFATAPQTSDTTYCELQYERFLALLDQLEEMGVRIPIRHFSNSGATILFPEKQLDMVRPGTAIYGLYPGPELEDMEDVPMYPGMSVKAKLAYVKKAPAGTKVSYTGSFTTARESLLGIVPLGYVDGVFRNLANRGEVLVHGQRCPMVGNICMDQFVIDLTDLPDVPVEGDEVVLIGRQGDAFISAEEVGELAGTISIEVLCGLGKRMPVIYKD